MIKTTDPLFLYIEEQERRRKIQSVIQEIKNIPDETIGSITFNKILTKYDLENLSEKELEYIMAKIKK